MFTCEADVWAFMKKHLSKDGWDWERTEVVQPAGWPDLVGTKGRRTVFAELKHGPPRVSALRPSQRAWLTRKKRQGAEIYVVFGEGVGVRWFDDPTLAHELSSPPDFWGLRPC